MIHRKLSSQFQKRIACGAETLATLGKSLRSEHLTIIQTLGNKEITIRTTAKWHELLATLT